MSFSSRFFNVAFVCGASFLAMYPIAAKASFDWTPPPAPVVQAPQVIQNVEPVTGPLTPELDAPASMAAPAAPAAPVSVVDVTPLAPQSQEEVVPTAGMKFLPAKDVPAPMPASVPSPATEPVVLDAPVAPIVAPAPIPVMPEKETVSAQPIPVTPAEPVVEPVVAEVSKNVEGFGKEIPLALALRDIAPSDYAYVFEAGEMAGRRISWRGGKPWKEVLDAALAPIGLKGSVQGKVIMISGQQTTTATAVSLPAPAEEIVTESSSPVVATAVMEAAPAAKKSAMPVVDLTVKRQWNARPGKTLRDVLEQWSGEANVALNWSTAYDYPIANAFYFDGTFGDAVDAILSSYGGEHPAPKGRLYPNLPDGPSVLMIN